MKKLLSLLLCVAFTLALFACGEPENPSEPASSEPSSEDIMGGGLTFTEPLRLAGLKGPTSLGMLKIMEDDAGGAAKNEYVFT
ncbi:MAG: ABC transporter substrate-binding protein, partial [Clostridiales bacterium]|nr:ABC transporter substrate-binding protein [Candidatus Coliplasma equi]